MTAIEVIGPRPIVCGCGCEQKPQREYMPQIKARDEYSGKEILMECGPDEVLKGWPRFQRMIELGRDWWLHWA